MEGVEAAQQNQEDEEDWIVVTGTQKQKILAPESRRGPGRPRLFAGPKAEDQIDLSTFF